MNMSSRLATALVAFLGFGFAGPSFAAVPSGVATLVTRLPSSYQFSLSGPVKGSDGNFYAIGSDGILRITPGGKVSTLNSHGGLRLVAGPDGALYAIKPLRYLGDPETVFRVTLSGEYTLLHTFDPDTEGRTPLSLVAGPDGNLYGTVYNDGPTGAGSVFRVSPSGDFALVHSFDGSDGYYPLALVVGGDGNLYGYTECGGPVDCGALFGMTLNGTLTMLHGVDSQSNYGFTDLIWSSDGNLYGILTDAYRPPELFRLSPSGTYTTLVTGLDGKLVQAPDGNLILTTLQGVVYYVTLSGAVTKLYTMDRDDEGNRPVGRLVQDGPKTFLGLSREPTTVYRLILGASFTLHPKQGHAAGGSQTCVSAIQLGATAPVTSALVSFDRTGMNPGSAQVLTDAAGKATHCWTGSNFRYNQRDEVDAVKASNGTLTRNGTMTWERREPDLTTSGIYTNGKLNPSARMVWDTYEYVPPWGRFIPLPGRRIDFYATLTSKLVCSAYTDASGNAKCSPTVVDHAALLNGFTAVFGGDAQWYPAQTRGALVSSSGL